MKTHIVYKIVSKKNGKGYIGMTSRTREARWKSHLSAARNGSPYRFHSAIRLHGEDAWTLEVLFETDNHLAARDFEAQAILDADYMTKGVGYNAKPGGCGGWIVPEEKYEAWRAKIGAAGKGAKNANSLPITNEEMIELGVAFANEHGFIAGHRRIHRYAASKGIKFPKSFQEYRFGSSFANYIREIETRTGIRYNPYHRDETQRRLARETLGKTLEKRWSNDQS